METKYKILWASAFIMGMLTFLAFYTIPSLAGAGGILHAIVSGGAALIVGLVTMLVAAVIISIIEYVQRHPVISIALAGGGIYGLARAYGWI